VIRRYGVSDKLGERLKSLIQKTGLSQIQFAQKHGIAQSSLSLWITGKRIPSYTKVMEVSHALKHEGIPFSTDWAFKSTSFNLSENNSLDVINEISLLKHLYETFSVLLISDTSMEPRFFIGEYVGGVLNQEPEMSENLVCLVETIDGFRGIRSLSYDNINKTYNARPLNNTFNEINFPKEHLQGCYKVFWHRII